MSSLPGFPTITPVEAEETFGVLFVSYGLSGIAYGFTIYLSYRYYTTYPADSASTKGFVLFLFALDTACIALLSHAFVIVFHQLLLDGRIWPRTYFYIVTSLPFIAGIAATTQIFTISILLSSISGSVAQCYYAIRLWRLRLGHGALIGLLCLVSLGCNIVLFVMRIHDPLITHLNHRLPKTIMIFSLASPVASSLFILFVPRNCLQMPTSDPSHHFAVSESSLVTFYKGSDNLLTLLITHGLAGLLLQSGALISFCVRPEKIFYLPFFLLSMRSFVNGPLYLQVNFISKPPRQGSHAADTRLNTYPIPGTPSTNASAQETKLSTLRMVRFAQSTATTTSGSHARESADIEFDQPSQRKLPSKMRPAQVEEFDSDSPAVRTSRKAPIHEGENEDYDVGTAL
ncbi:unnamed protein product [Mycena citricolor]|uniref:Uncharacterized protein n=1 Tax=Mycena citricolor TaxID=2018698 RepID=A0AAD2HSD6_9AGAR|nr:unnamed protein product [Mycena citricolor]